MAGRRCVKLYALIVDPYYATGSQLAGTVKGLPSNVIPIAVLSRRKPPTMASLKDGDFPHSAIVHGKKLDTTVDAIRKLIGIDGQIVSISTGLDRGNPLVDKLTRAFNLPGNDPDTSDARHDKVAITKALAAAKVPLPETHVVESLDDKSIDAIIASGKWPYYVQPPASAGSDHTGLVYNEKELREAIDGILGKTNQQRLRNKQVLVREYIDGPQYAVNGIRFIDPKTGRVVTRITGLWFQGREGPDGEYPPHVTEHNELLPSQGKLQDLLVDANDKVLDALGMNVGFFHVEYRVRGTGKNRVAIPIDPNLRPAGTRMPILEGLGTNQKPMEMGLQAHQPTKSLIEGPARYELTKPVVVVYIRSHGKARLSKRMESELQRMKAAGELIDYEYEMKEGTRLRETKDADGTVAKIFSHDPKHIELFRKWEQDGLFEDRDP